MTSNDRGQAEPAALQPGHVSARHIRGLLERAGLRFSITRLKVIEAFLAAAACASHQAGGVSVQDIQRRLAEGGEALSLLNMRQILRRLVNTGLLLRLGRGRYCLNPGYADEPGS